jgi:hypothetical protein
MEYVYMGIFSSVFNWVLDRIFTPVFEWLAKLLNTVLSWLFNKVLGPLLQNILWPLIQQTLKLIMSILAGVLYAILAKLLTILDNINKVFDYMIGLENITYVAESGSKGESMALLDAFIFKMPGVSTAFWMINFAGLTLAMVLAIIAVSKSTLDLDFDNRRPVSKVMSSLLKCVVNLFTVQFFVYFMIKLSAIILSGVNSAMNQISENGASTTLGRIIFCVVSMNAATNTEYNLDTSKTPGAIGISDKVRNPFYLGTKDFTNTNVVKESFDLAKFDYLMGYALALFMIVIMIACVVVFIRRIYDVLILYLTSPYFIAMMPIDDGQRFGAWRELFIGKLFSGFGMVMAMKLYIMLCPAIMGGSLIFSNDSPELNYMAKMLFLLGGAWATLKSGTVVTNLISAGAGADESQTANATSGALFAAGGSVAGVATAAAFRGIGSAVGSKFSKARQSRSESQKAFDDTKFKKNGNTSGGGETSRPSVGSETSGPPVGRETPAPVSTSARRETPEPVSTSEGRETPAPASTSEGRETPAPASTSEGRETPEPVNTSAGRETPAPANAAVSNASGASGSQKKYFADQKGGKQTDSLALGFKKYKMNDGSTRIGFNFGGKLLGVKRDEKGTKFQLMGISWRKGNDGKINKVSVFGAVKRKRGVDGELHTSKVNFAGLKYTANSETGELKFTDFNMLGIHREQQENGEYRVTSALGGLYQESFAKQEDGSLQTVGIRFMGKNMWIDEEAAKHNRNQNES